jgi:hypothetical protein
MRWHEAFLIKVFFLSVGVGRTSCISWNGERYLFRSTDWRSRHPRHSRRHWTHLTYWRNSRGVVWITRRRQQENTASRYTIHTNLFYLVQSSVLLLSFSIPNFPTLPNTQCVPKCVPNTQGGLCLLPLSQKPFWPPPWPPTFPDFYEIGLEIAYYATLDDQSHM